jgi:hypothetical protein
MELLERYRAEADHCRQAAVTSKSARSKAEWLGMAERWLDLANRLKLTEDHAAHRAVHVRTHRPPKFF